MNSIGVRYRFFLVFQSVQREVYPLNFLGGVKYSYERQKGSIFFQKKLAGALVFTNLVKDSIFDYDYLEAIEDGAARCDIIQLEIVKSCDRGTSWSTDFTGEFGVSDGRWDRDRCQFEVTPQPTGYYNCLLTDLEVNILGTSPTVTTHYVAGSNPVRNYTRSRRFDDMLLYLAQQTCSNITQIKSDFFQINADNPSLINYVTGELNQYTLMTVSQKSDVKDPIPSDAATKAITTWKRVMDDLQTLFNVYWTLDGTTVRIEHESYFATQPGPDLTTAQYRPYLSGKNVYAYDRNDSPRYENWIMPDSPYQGAKITYDNACGNTRQNESSVNYTLNTLYTDLTALRLVPSLIKSLDGIVLFATKFNVGTGQYDVLGPNNDELILGRLILKFHRWNRPQLEGELQGYGTMWNYTARKLKKQEEFKIPLCCGETFDTAKYMTTDLGKGDPEKATYDPKSEMLTVQLAYGPDPNIDIEPDDLQGLVLWLKGDDSNPAGAAATWPDNSGNANDATQGVAARQPVKTAAVVNGLPAYYFDGVDDGMTTPAIQCFPSKRGSVFIVFNPDKPIDNLYHHIVGSYGSGVGNLWDINLAWDGASGPTGAPPSSLNRAQLYSFVESTNLGVDSIGEYINDVVLGYIAARYGYDEFILFNLVRDADASITTYGFGAEEPGPISVANAQQASQPVNIGNSFIAGNSDPFAGYIAEIIVFNRELTEVERQQIERYLTVKYALVGYRE